MSETSEEFAGSLAKVSKKKSKTVSGESLEVPSSAPAPKRPRGLFLRWSECEESRVASEADKISSEKLLSEVIRYSICLCWSCEIQVRSFFQARKRTGSFQELSRRGRSADQRDPVSKPRYPKTASRFVRRAKEEASARRCRGKL
ncbi:hypothetical protein LIER_24892 [Lithospermum erythrorhizon]|uniref:Uncharacterized protein n=1 Tax=Lithospermum erythrorhizon TaxID=34254 RepID=A0AAV3R502_LITER